MTWYIFVFFIDGFFRRKEAINLCFAMQPWMMANLIKISRGKVAQNRRAIKKINNQVYKGWYLPSYVGMFIRHHKDPVSLLNNQYVRVCFFAWLKCRLGAGFSICFICFYWTNCIESSMVRLTNSEAQKFIGLANHHVLFHISLLHRRFIAILIKDYSHPCRSR